MSVDEVEAEVEVDKSISLPNPYLKKMSSDVLYHLGIEIRDTANTQDIVEQFGDIRFFVMGGVKERMHAMAILLRKLNLPGDDKAEIVDIACKVKRFAIYKVGPVLCCSHGIGQPSLNLLLNELLKLAKYAKCVDPVFIRLGTCGGIGVVPGTVVISDRVFNEFLKTEHEFGVLGNRVIRRTKFDGELSQDIFNCANKNDNFLTIRGNTLCTNCFYEGQGRLDGAICSYTEEEKFEFLKKCFIKYGIKNIEMETVFAAMTNFVGVRAASVCVAIVNRLKEDQVKSRPEELALFQMHPLIVVARYIHCTLHSKIPKVKQASAKCKKLISKC